MSTNRTLQKSPMLAIALELLSHPLVMKPKAPVKMVDVRSRSTQMVGSQAAVTFAQSTRTPINLAVLVYAQSVPPPRI